MAVAGWTLLISVLYFVVGTWLVNKNGHGHGTSGDLGLWMLVVALPSVGCLLFSLIAFLCALF